MFRWEVFLTKAFRGRGPGGGKRAPQLHYWGVNMYVYICIYKNPLKRILLFFSTRSKEWWE